MNKTALITGASRGLGASLAEALAPGYHIIAVARTTGALEDLDDRIQAKGGRATLAPMDICDAGAMATLCRGVYDRWGHLDLWLHTAIHAAPLSPADHVDMKDWDKSVQINASATARLIPFVAPLLGLNSKAVFFDDPQAGKFYGAYGASKAAQMSLARSWQVETAKTGPEVVIHQPAPMATALRARFFPGEDKTRLARPRDEAQRVVDGV